MGQIILSNVLLLAGKFNFSGKLNAIAFSEDPDVKDCTVFGNTAKNRKQGLPLITAALAGFFDQEPDEYFSNHSLTNIPMTIAPTPAEGGPAYSFLSKSAEYQFGGEVGEMFKFSVKAESVGTKLIRGNILLNDTKDASGNGTPFHLGVGTGKTIYGVLHVISASPSDTLDVIIQSDALEAFGSPVSLITFAQVALGVDGGGSYEWAVPVAGNADEWYRVNFVLGGGSPSFSFAVFIGASQILTL